MRFRYIASSLAAVLILSIIFYFTGMPFHETWHSSHPITFDFQTLGEYPTSVRRITITDLNGTVLDIQANGRYFQSRKFTLEKGVNKLDAFNAEWGSFRVVTPVSPEFALQGGVKYTVSIYFDSIWGIQKLRRQPIIFE